MAGRGFAPKDPSKLAGHGAANRAGLRVITASPVSQPDLPEFDVAVKVHGDVQVEQFEWPERTREWWRMWSESPLSASFTANDWSELLDTALLHARFWGGDLKLAAELRLRVAKFGATPEDRARLRITFADADERDEKRSARTSESARKRYGGSRAVGSD